MLSAPKGQAGIQDSQPLQVSLSMMSLAIRFSSYEKLEKWKNGMLGQETILDL
jgi:hypothetical protein